MKKFSEFMCESFLLEMPHIKVGDDIIDLELEVHNKMKPTDFLDYIKRWLNGDIIASKSPNFEMHVNKNAISDFAKKLSNNYFFKMFVIKNYGIDIWDDILVLLATKS